MMEMHSSSSRNRRLATIRSSSHTLDRETTQPLHRKPLASPRKPERPSCKSHPAATTSRPATPSSYSIGVNPAVRNPIGSVTFYDNGTSLDTVLVDNIGIAIFTIQTITKENTASPPSSPKHPTTREQY